MGWLYGLGIPGVLLVLAAGLLLVLAAVALVVWTVSGRRERPAVAPPRVPSPREVLDLQLAGGEIDVETYVERREALSRPA